MNKQGRKAIEKALEVLRGMDLESVESDVETLSEEEGEKFENLSDGLKAGEKGQAIEEAKDALESAKESITEAKNAIEEAINRLESIV